MYFKALILARYIRFWCKFNIKGYKLKTTKGNSDQNWLPWAPHHCLPGTSHHWTLSSLSPNFHVSRCSVSFSCSSTLLLEHSPCFPSEMPSSNFPLRICTPQHHLHIIITTELCIIPYPIPWRICLLAPCHPLNTSQATIFLGFLYPQRWVFPTSDFSVPPFLF